MITGKTQLCMVIGSPVNHSLSPIIHNAGYQAAGIADTFVYVASEVLPESIQDFVAGMRAMHIRGVSCTMPHKEIIMPFLDHIDETAKAIGAVNTVVQQDGELWGYNTDWIGTVEPLKALTDLHGKKVSVIGAGGAAKAMVFGLVREGAEVTIHNRTIAKAEDIAKQFGCKAASITDIATLQQADILCNATSVGMGETVGQAPIDTSCIHKGQIVLDAIYSPLETTLLKDAAAKGATIVHGTEMLLHQALPQFKLYTGADAPEDIMRQAILDALNHKDPDHA